MTHFLLEHDITSQGPIEDVYLDYDFGDEKLDSSRVEQRKQGTNTSQYSCVIRHMAYYSTIGVDDGSNPQTCIDITPLFRSHPIRGELEIDAFGRPHLEQFDTRNTGRHTVSVPLVVFIDGFGVYQNSYRSLMGVYLIPAALTFQERARRANVFPLTLGPHGSNFPDVINALQSMKQLDRGLVTTMPGSNEDVMFCAFPVMFIGDLPQQQKNSGMKSARANLVCRFCFVDEPQRGELETYDTFLRDRYHHQTVVMRQDLNALRRVTERNKYGMRWGMDTVNPSLSIITHRRVTVTGCIQAKYCQQTLGLVTNSTNMDIRFRRALILAFADYDMPNIAYFPRSSIKWCKKFSFTDPSSERRVTFKENDFVEVREYGIVRVNHICIVTFDSLPYLFIHATRLQMTPGVDPILGDGYRILPTRPDEMEPQLIGLPRITAKQLYIVPVVKDHDVAHGYKLGGGGANEFIWAHRSLQWL